MKPSRSSLAFVSASFLIFCSTNSWAGDVYWINSDSNGAAYTSTGNWSNSENGSSNGTTPGSGDRPMLTNGGKILIESGNSITSNGVRVASGTIAMSGGTWNASSGQMNVGFAGTGELILTGNAAITGSTLYLANSNGTGTFSLSDTSSYTSTGTGNYTIIGRNGTGTLNVLGNATFISVSDNFSVGSAGGGGTGTINLSENGTLTSASVIRLGYEGTNSQGTINVSGNATLNANSGINIGDYNSGMASSTGTLTVNGGTIRTTTISLATGSVSSGTLNFNGGTIEADDLIKGTGTAAINLNGGTFKITNSAGSFFSNFSSADISLLAGGVTFDTGNHNVGIEQSLNGAGGLTKKGTGTLTLEAANQIGGTIVIEEGTLVLSTAGTFATIKMLADTELKLDGSGNYLLSGLIVDGTAIGAGTYDDTALMDKFFDLGILDVAITLNSGATLTIIPEPTTYAGIGGLTLLALILVRRRKH